MDGPPPAKPPPEPKVQAPTPHSPARKAQGVGPVGRWDWAEMPLMGAGRRSRWSLVLGPFFRGVLINRGCGPTAEMVIPNLKEGDPELLDAEGVDDGVHG